MAQDKQVSKVIYAGETLIDLTADTISAEYVIGGKSFHKADGVVYTGTCTYDADTSSATASADEILNTKTAYVRGNKITGSMPNNGAVAGTISTKAGQYTIGKGYHDGSGKVSISSTEQAKLVAGNIKHGVTILGVHGSYAGDSTENPQSKTVTPTKDGFAVLPDTGYTCLSQVTVNAIPYSAEANAAGGVTVSIG